MLDVIASEVCLFYCARCNSMQEVLTYKLSIAICHNQRTRVDTSVSVLVLRYVSSSQLISS